MQPAYTLTRGTILHTAVQKTRVSSGAHVLNAVYFRFECCGLSQWDRQPRSDHQQGSGPCCRMNLWLRSVIVSGGRLFMLQSFQV